MDYAPQKLLPLLMVGMLVSSSATYSMNVKKEHLWCAGGILSGIVAGYALKSLCNSYLRPYLFPARYVRHNDACQYIINEATGDTYIINPEKSGIKAKTFKNNWHIPCNPERGSFIWINKLTNKSTFSEGKDIHKPMDGLVHHE